MKGPFQLIMGEKHRKRNQKRWFPDLKMDGIKPFVFLFSFLFLFISASGCVGLVRFLFLIG